MFGWVTNRNDGRTEANFFSVFFFPDTSGITSRVIHAVRRRAAQARRVAIERGSRFYNII